MEKPIAKSIMDIVLAMEHPVNRLFEMIEKIEDETERAKFREHAGFLMRDLTFGFVLPIASLYPDLDPDREDLAVSP